MSNPRPVGKESHVHNVWGEAWKSYFAECARNNQLVTRDGLVSTLHKIRAGFSTNRALNYLDGEELRINLRFSVQPAAPQPITQPPPIAPQPTQPPPVSFRPSNVITLPISPPLKVYFDKVKDDLRRLLMGWISLPRYPLNINYFEAPFLYPIFPPYVGQNVGTIPIPGSPIMYVALPSLWFQDTNGLDMLVRSGEYDDGARYIKQQDKSLSDKDPRQLVDENGVVIRTVLTSREVPQFLGPPERATMRVLPYHEGAKIRYWLHPKVGTDVVGWEWHGILRQGALVQV